MFQNSVANWGSMWSQIKNFNLLKSWLLYTSINWSSNLVNSASSILFSNLIQSRGIIFNFIWKEQ